MLLLLSYETDTSDATTLAGYAVMAMMTTKVIEGHQNRYQSKESKKEYFYSAQLKQFILRRRNPVCDFLLDLYYNFVLSFYCLRYITIYWSTIYIFCRFSHPILRISTAYAVMRCPSVCISVRLSGSWILSKQIHVNISSNFFHRRVATSF